MVTHKKGCQSVESGQEAWQLNWNGFSIVAPPKNPGIHVELSFSTSLQSWKEWVVIRYGLTFYYTSYWKLKTTKHRKQKATEEYNITDVNHIPQILKSTSQGLYFHKLVTFFALVNSPHHAKLVQSRKYKKFASTPFQPLNFPHEKLVLSPDKIIIYLDEHANFLLYLTYIREYNQWSDLQIFPRIGNLKSYPTSRSQSPSNKKSLRFKTR